MYRRMELELGIRIFSIFSLSKDNENDILNNITDFCRLFMCPLDVRKVLFHRNRKTDEVDRSSRYGRRIAVSINSSETIGIRDTKGKNKALE